MPATRRSDYDADAFREAWWSNEPGWSIACRLGVSVPAVYAAAMRRGFPSRRVIRAGMV